MHNIIITENGTEIMVKMVDQETEEEENNVEEQGLGDGEMQFFFVAQTEWILLIITIIIILIKYYNIPHFVKKNQIKAYKQ